MRASLPLSFVSCAAVARPKRKVRSLDVTDASRLPRLGVRTLKWFSVHGMGDEEDAWAESRVIKEGFLVKKGHLRKNWRTRWFVLQRDSLCYYKNRGDSAPIDSIPLEGCSVRKPADEVLRHPHLFELLTPSGRVYQLEAANTDDLASWSSGIAKATQSFAALRRHVSVKQRHISVSQHVLDTNSQELLQAMQDQEAGVRLSERRISSDTTEVCFAGAQLVDWLIEWAFSNTRHGASLVGLSLLNGGYIQPVDRNLLTAEEFCDSEDAFYRFSAFRVGDESPLPFTDSTSLAPADTQSGSDSSSDEMAGCFPVTKASAQHAHGGATKHTEIKQGILVKKGHKRRNWKARRFVLFSNALYYFRASKPQSEPMGFIPLKGASVELYEASDVGGRPRRMMRTESGSTLSTNQSGALFVITTAKPRCVPYLLQASSDDERSEWIEAIQSAISDCR